MYRLTSTKPRLLIFKSVARSSLLTCILILSIGFTLTTPDPSFAREEIVASPGDTFTVELNRESSFLRWSLSEYDPTRLSRLKVERGDITGPDRFHFEAIEPGPSKLTFLLEQNTVFGSEITDTRPVTVTVRSSAGAGESADGAAVISQDPPDIPQDVLDRIRAGEQSESGASGSSGSASRSGARRSTGGAPSASEEWDRVKELIELEKYQAARDVIEEQQSESQGDDAYRWANKRAESFREEGQIEQAVETWRSMIDDFPKGPIPRWRLSLAEAHREANQDDQAELELLKIRHRHQGHPVWPDAMIMLGNIASNRGDYERAQKLLEHARRVRGNHPRLVFQLARLYDRYDEVRNYERAVNLYQRAADGLSNQEPDLAKQARDRATYLQDNYVNFGFD